MASTYASSVYKIFVWLKLALKGENRKYFKNISWLLLEKLFRLFVGVSVGIWVARYLGPHEFGMLSFAQSLVVIFSAVSSLGIDSILIKELALNGNKLNSYLGTAFFLKLIAALSVLALLGVSIYVVMDDFYTAILVYVVASSMVFQSFNVIDLYFQSQVLGKYIAIVNLASMFVISILKVICIVFNAGLLALASLVIVEKMFVAIGLLLFYVRSNTSVFDWEIDKGYAIKLLGRSWPLIFAGMATMIYKNIDQVMLNQVLGSGAVGLYSAAVKLSDPVVILAAVIATSLYPALIRANDVSRAHFLRQLEKLCVLLVVLAFIVVGLVSSFSEWIISFLYGADYAESASVLSVYIFSLVFLFIHSASWRYDIILNYNRLHLYKLFLAAVLNVALNYYWIPVFGMIGAAWATVVSYAVAMYLGNLMFARTRPNFFVQSRALLVFPSLLKLLGSR